MLREIEDIQDLFLDAAIEACGGIQLARIGEMDDAGVRYENAVYFFDAAEERLGKVNRSAIDRNTATALEDTIEEMNNAKIQIQYLLAYLKA